MAIENVKNANIYVFSLKIYTLLLYAGANFLWAINSNRANELG